MIGAKGILTYGLYISLCLYGFGIFAPYLGLDYDTALKQTGATGILFFYLVIFFSIKHKTWSNYLALISVLILFLGVFGKLLYPVFGLLSSSLQNLSYFFILGILSFITYDSDYEVDIRSESTLENYTFGKEDFELVEKVPAKTLLIIKRNVQYLLYFFIGVSILGFISKLLHFYFASVILVIGFVSTAILVIINGVLKTKR